MSNIKTVGYLNTVTGHLWTRAEQPDAAEQSGLYEPLVKLSDVLGLVAERDALAAENVALQSALKTISESEQFEGDSFVCDFETLVTVACSAISKNPATDAAIAEIKARGVDDFTTQLGDKASQLSAASNVYKVLKGVVFSGVEFAANLRAGRKG